MTSQIDAYFQKKVQHRPATDDIRCWWDRVIQWIGPFLLLVGFIAMVLHVNVAVRCSVNGDIDLKAFDTNASSLQSTTLPNADFVNAQCSSQLGFPTKSFSGILIALAFILTLIGNLWFRVPITKSKMKTFKSRTDGLIKSSETQEKIKRMISDPGSTPIPDAYDDLKKQQEELWQYRQRLEKKRFLGRFYLAKSIVQLVFAFSALVFSLFFASWPPVHQGLFHCTLAHVRADYVCTRTLGTWFIILNTIYAIATVLYMAILLFGIVWYHKKGRKPYDVRITGREKSTNKQQEQVYVIDVEGGHNAAFEGGNDDPVPRRPPDGEAETSFSGSKDDGIAEVHSPKREQEEVDTFQGDAAFMMRLLERNKSEEVEHVTRMMSRPLKEMLEGLVFDPDEIRIHHETIEDDDTVTVNLEWKGPLKGEYSGFRITVEKRTDGNFVVDNADHVVKADVGKERQRTACLRHLERGSVYKVRIFTVLEKEGVIRTSHPSKIVIATKPPEPSLFVLKKSSGGFERSDRSLELTGMVDKGNVTSFLLQYSVYSTHVSKSGTHSKTATKLYAIPEVIKGEGTDIQVRDLLPGTLYRFMLKCRCDYSKMETEERPINMDASHTESGFVEITVITNPGEVNKVELQNEGLAKLDTTTSVPIRWVKPKGNVDRYTVFYRESQDEAFREVTSDKESCILYGLTPGTEYTVNVAAECCTDSEVCTYPRRDRMPDTETAESDYIQGERIQADIKIYTHPAKPLKIATSSTCTSIDVTWGEPLGQVQSYLVSWSDGNCDTGSKLVPSDVCTYTINYLQPGTKYTLSVQAKSNEIHSEKESVSTVTVPDSAVDVTISEFGDDTSKVRVAWRRLQGRVDFYSVTCLDRAIQRECYCRKTSAVDWHDEHSVDIDDLKPGRSYEVSITAVSWELQGQKEAVKFSTKPNPPKRVQLDSKAGLDRSTFQWETPVGDVEEYFVRIKQKDGSHCFDDIPTTANGITVSDLSPGTNYLASVVSFSQGKESVPSCIPFITEPAPPEEIRLELRDDTSVFVTWRPPSDGLYDEYIAGCYSWETGDKIKELKLAIEKAEFGELIPGTKYKFTVQSCSNCRFSQTAEKNYLIRPGKPTVLKQEIFDTRTLFLQWQPPHGIVNQYIVKYSGEKVVTTEDTGKTLQNLTPGTSYSGEVVARVHDKGLLLDGLAGKWTALTDPASVEDCDITQLTPRSVQLFWKQPEGRIDHYHVSYWPKGKAYSSRKEEMRNTLLSLTDLDPGTSYEAEITTMSNRRTSEPYQISFSTDPAIPLDVAGLCRDSTNVDVKWNNPGGSFDFFIVQWQSEDEAGVYGRKETENTHQTIAGLCPGYRYEVSVVTVSNGKESEPCSIQVQTDPASIAAIVSDPGTDTFTLKWTKPTGKADGYELQLKGQKDPQDENMISFGEKEEAEIHGLTPGTTYLASLFTVRNNQKSKPYCFKCSTEPSKCVPKCSARGSSYLSIAWEPVTGGVLYYEVQCKIGERVSVTKIPQHNDTKATFDKLQPGTEYRVVIRTVADNAVTESDPLFIFTDPDMVGEIKVHARERSANLTWQPPTGKWERFRVCYWDNRTKKKIDKHTDKCEYEISTIVPGDKYFVVITTFVNETESKERTATIVTEPLGINDCKMEHQTLSSVQLSWERPDGHFDHFLVSYWPCRKPYDSRSKKIRETLIGISDLDPGTSYEAQITTVSNGRPSEPYEITFSTDPDEPLDFKELCRGLHHVDVKWNKPRGLFDHFIVRWRSHVGAEPFENKIQANTRHTISGLSPGEQYEISVVTVSNGKESKPCRIDVQTDPAATAAMDIVHDLNKIKMEWTKPEGKFDGYQLELIGPKDPPEGKMISLGETEEYISELTPGTTYRGRLFTVRKEQRSKPYCFDFSTKPPKCVPICSRRSTRHLKFTWEEPEGEVRYFTARLNKNNELVQSKKIPRDFDTETTFDELLPGTEYSLIIYTFTENGETKSDPLIAYTVPEKVGDIEVQTQERSAILSWAPPPGYCERFRVSRLVNKQDRIDEYTDKCLFYLRDLEPGKQYFVEVTALVNEIESKKRAETFVTVPAMIIKESIHKTEGVATFALTWGQPIGGVDGYVISVKQENQDSDQEEFEKDSPYAEIRKITPGICYTIGIKSRSHSNQSDPCYIQLKKHPAPPMLLHDKDNVTSNKITLRWNSPHGMFEKYQIFHKKDGDDEGICKDLSARNTYVLNDLQPSTHYTGWIRTLSKQGLESEHANFDCFTEPEPPQHFSCLKDQRGTTTLILEWEASKGDIEGYTLTIRDTDGTETPHVLEPSKTRHKVEDLTPGMMYHCLISTTSQAGVKSSYVECQTSTVPEVPKATVNKCEGAYVVCWDTPRGVFKHMSSEYVPSGSKKDLKTLTTKESPSPPLSVTPGTVYHLQVFSVTDHDQSGPCTLQFTTVPLKPVLYQVNSESTSVSISWKPAQELCSYEVSCEQAGINIINPEITSECEFTLNNLLPATKYDVKIATCVKDHEGKMLKSETSDSSIWTNPSTPTKFKQTWSRQNKKRQTTSVKLEWEMAQEDIDHFEIIYDAPSVGRNTITVKGSKRTAEIHRLEPGTEYNCSISAILRMKQKGGDAECVANTAPAIPGTIVNCVASTDGLYLEWMPAAAAFHYYTVAYRDIQEPGTNSQGNSNAETQTKLSHGIGSDKPAIEGNIETLDDDEKKVIDARYKKIKSMNEKCNLENLDPGTNYEIRIFAITNNYPSQPQQLTHATKPGKPGDVKKAKTTSDGSISLSWGASEGNVSGYEIEYGRKDNTTTQRLSSSAPNCIIDNISPGVLYSYKVYAISNGIRGDSSEFVAATDLPCPVNFRETKSTSRSIYLQWDAPPSVAVSSWSYTVKHRRSGTSDKFQSDKLKEDGATSVDVSGLVPGRKYDFSVQVTGWKDEVGHSTSKEVFCTGTTDPEPVHNLKWIPSTNTLSWEKPVGDIERYDIKFVMGKTLIKSFNEKTCEHKFHHIENGETYTFCVVAVSNEKQSREVSKTVTIVPGSPAFAKEKFEVTTSTITLHWNPPGGKVKHYVLSYKPIDKDMGFFSRIWSGGERHEKVNDCFATLYDLNPGFKYRIRVCAEVDGARDEKGDTFEVVTEPAKPDIEWDLSSKTLVLHSTCSGTCRKDCYEVRYKCRKDQNYQTIYLPSKTKSKAETLDLFEWQPGHVYDVEVRSLSYSKTDSQVKSEPVNSTVCTVPSKPKVRYEVSETSFSMCWRRKTEPGVDKITVACRGSGGFSVSRVIDDVNVTTRSIDKLQPGTQYQAEVIFHCGDKSSSSGLIDIMTDPVPPAMIYKTYVSTSTANIEWDQPKGQYDHMIVTLTDLTTNEQRKETTGELFIKYTKLRPATSYRVEVLSVKKPKESVIKSQDFCTAALSPTGIRIVPSALSANISWTYHDKSENDDITFKIKYWEVNPNGSIHCQTVISYTSQKTLEPLTPGSHYKIQVQTIFQEMESEAYETSFVTEPSSVTNVQVQGFATYAKVRWKPPDHGKVKGYFIAFWPASNESAKQQVTCPYHASSGTIEGLRQGTQYIVEVTSYVEGRQSQASGGKFFTVPSPPSIICTDTTPDSITLKWSRREDELDVKEAIVRYRPPDATQEVTEPVSTKEPQQFLITSLKPKTHLTGYVELVCGDKVSDKTPWSATTDAIQAKQIHVGSITETTARLSWADVDTSKTVVYRVVCKKKALPLAASQPKGVDIPFMPLTRLEPGTEYTVFISAVVDGVESKHTTAEFTTRPGKPKVVRLVGTPTADSAAIEWEPPVGAVDYYRLEYKTGKGEPVVETIPKTKSSCELTGLAPGIEYIVSLSCIIHKEESEKSIIPFITAVPIPVASVQPGSTSIFLSWSNYKSNADSFEITCQSQDGRDEEPVQLSGNQQQHTFENLSENTRYSGKILAKLGFQKSEPYEWACLTSAEPAKVLQAKEEGTTPVACISVSLKLVKTKSKGAEGVGSCPLDLVVVLKRGKDLPNIRHTKNFETYCTGVIIPNEKEKRKAKKVGGESPEWNETMEFKDLSFDDLRSKSLQIKVKEYLKIGKNPLIGEIRLNMGTGMFCGKPVDWMDSTEQEQKVWKALLDSTPGKEISADLPLRGLEK